MNNLSNLVEMNFNSWEKKTKSSEKYMYTCTQGKLRY